MTNSDMLYFERNVGAHDGMVDLVEKEWFATLAQQEVGYAGFILRDILEWADVTIDAEPEGIQIALHGVESEDEGYCRSLARVSDPRGTTGRPLSFFADPFDASFISVSWLYVGDSFNCDLLRSGHHLARLRIAKMARVAVTRLQ